MESEPAPTGSPQPRSALLKSLQALLLISGWAVAIGLGLRLRETPPPAPTPPTATTTTTTPAPVGPVEEGEIAKIFRAFTEHPQVAGSLVALCLLDENGQTIFASPLAETALCPASSLKTVTTGAALGVLGPDYRFETTLASAAPLGPGGALAGDLILIGSGDPTFSQGDLFQLADAAVAAGLKTVAGRIVVDGSAFPDDPMSEHWNWGDIGNAYGAGAFGLNLDHNRLTIGFDPGPQPGAPARLLGSTPVTREMRWDNRVVTGAAGSGDQVVVYSTPYGRSITLRGSVPAGESNFSISAANPDPPSLAAELLRTRLEAAGVKFSAQSKLSPATERTVLASHRSAPIVEIIPHLHRVSDNLEAQCLFLTIGRQQKADPSAAVQQYWEKNGVSFVGLRLIDGNGLARANMIRPLDLARVNHAARHGPQGEAFFQSLSTYVNGNARAKIGGMSGVKTQVGFLRTAQNRELTYAFMANGLPVDRALWGRLEELLENIRVAKF